MEPWQPTISDNDRFNERYLQQAPVQSISNATSDHVEKQYSVDSGVKRRRLHAISFEIDNTSAASLIALPPRPALNDANTTGNLVVKRSHNSVQHEEHRHSVTKWSLSHTPVPKECLETICITVTDFQHTQTASVTQEERQVSETCSSLYAISAEPQTVCYGMLRHLEYFQLPEAVSMIDDVRYENGTILFMCGTAIQLSHRSANILDSLTNVDGTSLELSCVKTTRISATHISSKARFHASDRTFALAAVLYGSEETADDIGEWLTSIRLHLQTPTSCKLTVPYHNPHKITDLSTAPIMTNQLNLTKPPTLTPKAFDDDALRQLYTDRSFDMASQPALLKTTLHCHQREALTFMQQREADVDLQADKNSYNLWRRDVDAFGRTKYVEVLTGQSLGKAPPHCRGGLLADEMGLGKTCTMLALIASDITTVSEGRVLDTSGGSSANKKSTLIIVPLPLLQVWEQQIHRHLRSGAVKLFTFHGSQRNSVASFDDLDIVLTTYDTVSGEYRRSRAQSVPDSHLVGRYWHRIVLDEAHVIKNKDTYIAKAVTSLHADRKWCITGTPIQNRMSDLFSLLRFLNVCPYNDFRKFDQVFLQPWRNAQTEALHKLQYLMSGLAIRRPRTTITLPTKTEITIPVILSPRERLVYEQTKQGLVEIFDAALDNAEDAKSYYLSALQRINDLRFVCNHGKAPQRTPPSERSAPAQNPDTLQQELGLLFGRDVMETHLACAKVGQTRLLEVPSSGQSAISSGNSPRPLSPAETIDDDTNTMTLSMSDETPSPLSNSAIPGISSKISALVGDITSIPPTEKCVVFSFWTTTLNMIACALDTHSIPNTRYDGSMSRSKRDAVLDNFAKRTAAEIKVILVSISCGGQGLDLTAANHAYLVEPQWNPMAEEQALSRVYRLGQERPVRLCRLVADDTWEQRIVGLQEKKRKLAELIVDRVALDAKGEHESRQDHQAHGGDARRLLAWLRDLVS